MTAKEMLNKRKFNPDEPIALSESEVEDLMKEFALHIAEQAVGEEKKKAASTGEMSNWEYFRFKSHLEGILTRINELTAGK